MLNREKSARAPRCRFAVLICAFGLTATWQNKTHAQDTDCVARVRVTYLGVPTVTEDKYTMMRSVGSHRYRVDIATEERRCVNVDYNVVLRFLDRDGKPAIGWYPGSLRIRGGEASDFGNVPGHRNDSEVRSSVEGVVCKRVDTNHVRNTI